MIFKKIKGKTIITLCLSFAIAVCVFAGMMAFGGRKNSSPAFAVFDYQINQATNQSEESEEQEDTSSTLFFIDLGVVAINGEGETKETLIYDRYDGLVKILDASNNFKDENPSFKPNIENVTNIFTTSSHILLYSANSFEFEAYDFDYHPVDCDFSSLSGLQSAKYLDTITINSNDYLFISSDPSENNFQIAKLEMVENVLVANDVKNFSVDNLYTSITSYDTILLTQNDNNFLVMLINGNGILSFEVPTDFADNTVIATTTSVLGLSEEDTIKSAKFLEVSDKQLVAVQTESQISFYLFNSSPALALSKIDEIEINFDDTTLTDLFVKSGSIAIIFNESQTLLNYAVTYELEEYHLSFATKTNPSVEISYIDTENLEYYSVESDTILINSPYSRTKIVDVPENSNVVKIATASSDDNQIVGWTYVMASFGNKNYYGFIDSSLLTPLETENIQPYTISLLDYTVLRKYPSIYEDQVNSRTKSTQSNVTATVLSNACGYTSLGTTYFYVQIGEEKGFIDISSVKTNKNTNVKIITNAFVLNDSSEIFIDADNKSEVITYLNKGARVKIIGKRDTITNLTKITFNGDKGQEITGYIYTSNLQTDTWSMLQIIGMALVVLNIILLAIIIFVKNKLTK